MKKMQASWPSSFLAGLGGSLLAFGLLGLRVVVKVVVESDATAHEVRQRHSQSCAIFIGIQAITFKDIAKLKVMFTRLRGIVLGGGAPCQDLSMRRCCAMLTSVDQTCELICRCLFEKRRGPEPRLT